MAPFEIPINDGAESLELDFDDLIVDPTEDHVQEIASILTTHTSGFKYWTRSAGEYWSRNRKDDAIRLAQMGVLALRGHSHEAALPLQCQLAGFFLAQARTAPKFRLPNAQQDILNVDQLTKDEYWAKANELVNEVSNTDPTHPLLLDVKAMLAMAKGEKAAVDSVLNALLTNEPNHLLARIAQGRQLLAEKHYRAALKAFQQVLSAAPHFLPDPRIGIGECFWALGDKARARQAWERSIKVHGETGAATISPRALLGLSWLSVSRDIKVDESLRRESYVKGIGLLQSAFKENKGCAPAAAALAGYFSTRSQWSTAVKLAERAVQYADHPSAVAEGRLALARSLHATGDLKAAQENYAEALTVERNMLYPVLGAGQIFVAQEDYVHALNTFENALRRDPQCIEALANLAAVRAHLSFTTKPAADAADNRARAKEHYETMTRLFTVSTRGKGSSEISLRVSEVSRDPDLYIDIARLALVGEPDLMRAMKGYRESVAAREGQGGSVPAVLWNNLGVLQWRRGELEEAESLVERALAEASAVQQREGAGIEEDRVALSVMFNLAAVVDDKGDKEKARKIYERLLERHPEHAEAKARLSLLALQDRDFDGANALLKEALTSQPANVELRALYTYFLVESGQTKPARDFTISTLKDHDKHDIYALCASGMLLYSQARENKQQTPEASRDRASKFFRACEFYEKALLLDSKCMFAAHGLAIALAEGTLSAGISNDPAGRLKNTRDALSVLTKVRESVGSDRGSGGASVFINLGHCHYARDEYERAIENYSTASKKFYDNKNVQVLLYLARAWYQKASKDQSLQSLRSALSHAQAARDLVPADLPVAFNIALIQQKMLEVLLELPQERRALKDIKFAIAEAESAQGIFGDLAEERPDGVPFDRDTAHQRRRYGESLLKRVPPVLEAQAAYESTEASKVERARQEREAERQRVAEAERIRMQEIAARNEEIARKRQEMQEAAATWYVKRAEDEEDDAPRGRRKISKRKPKEFRGVENARETEGSGAASGSEDDKPKRKRTRKEKTRRDASAEKDESSEEDAGPVVKSRGSKKGNKNFKSAEYIDSDEE